MLSYCDLTMQQKEKVEQRILTNRFGITFFAVVYNIILCIAFLFIFKGSQSVLSKFALAGMGLVGISLIVGMLYYWLFCKVDSYQFTTGKVMKKWTKVSKDSGVSHYVELRLADGTIVKKLRVESHVYSEEQNEYTVGCKNGKAKFIV